MAQHQMLQLNDLSRCIAESCKSAIVSFDHDLTIIDSNPMAANLLKLESTLDQTLSAGTDMKIWGNWTDTLQEILKTEQPANFEAVKYTRGEFSRLLCMRLIPLKDTSTDTIIGAAAVVNDVAEKLDTEHEMAQAERLMAIGKVAGKVAHELNNPLDGILRYVNLAIRVLDQNQTEKAAEYLLHCRTGLQRMAQIITEMLEFSRTTNLAFETSPVDKMIDDALRAMEASLRDIKIEIVRTNTEPLPHLKSDAIFQVFCNLIKNASDAMDGRGRLTIIFSRQDEYCQIEFHDSGPGIASEQLNEIFRPFYTTKPKGRGTGLGLAICKDILEKLNGTISVRNHPQGGAAFLVELPSGQSINPNRSRL
ncbi:MAG: PAS domain-containing sensor histidine kinase [Planctomycetota bacterium]|jgi:signal transduction histidine kinase